MKSLLFTPVLLLAGTAALAQRPMPGMAMPPAAPAQQMPGRAMPADTAKRMPGTKPSPSLSGMGAMKMDSPGSMGTTGMRNSFSKNLPMTRQGSGTSWHPDNSPMYMQMYQPGGWDVMLMYAAFLRYTSQNATHADRRGDANFRANTYVMAMANHLVGQHGLFTIHAMLSTDPLTVGGAGYPLLFQTGESWQGVKLHDHQHPHDLVSALGVAYTYEASPDVDLTAYVGYPGEPATGPPVFMHRPSAANLPAAPLGHHWQDATHIQFGVATLGVRYRNAKLEGTLFTGREPNENRYSFDPARFDSYSARLSVNPAAGVALQASYAHIKSPEELEPERNVDRATASVLHNAALGGETVLSSAFVWGMNRTSGGTAGADYSYSFLLESNWQARQFNVFTRLETLQLTYDELLLPAATGGALHKGRQVSAFTLGASKYLAKTSAAWVDLGATGTLNAFNIGDAALVDAYGKTPLSFEVFIRVIAPRMSMHMSGMSHQGMKM